MTTPASADLSALARQVEQLADEVGRLNDVHAVRKLQHAYGYYLDKCLYDEVVDLFAADGEVRFMGGAFKGKPGLRRLYCERFRKNFTGGHNGPVYGFLLDHLQLQDIVELLQHEGVDIARRTVAKYREAMRIPSSVRRRREKLLAL